jgi:WD40 repeat protein
LATGGDAGRVVLIDAAEGKARPLETGAAAATALAFGPKGERLAVAAGDAPVRVFETASRRVLEEIPAAGVVRALAWGQANDILAIAANRVVLHRPKDRSTFGAASSTELLAFAPDGKSLAAAGAELPPVVWPLDRVGSEPRRPKEQPQHPVLAIGYAPVGSFLATAGGSAPVGESELLIWDAATLELRHRRPLPGPPWRLMAIHPEGRLLATANAEGDIALWDVATGLKLFSLKGPRQAVGLSFADRGRQLYVAPANGRLVCWIAPN